MSEKMEEAKQNESNTTEQEHELFIWRMVALDTETRAFVIAMDNSQVVNALGEIMVGGVSKRIWIVEDVKPIKHSPHIVCITRGVEPESDENGSPNTEQSDVADCTKDLKQ